MIAEDLLAKSRAALDHFVLSASGWRTVFSQSGTDEDARPELSPEHAILAGLMAQTFVEALPALNGKKSVDCVIAIGTDTRPTGPALVSAMLPVLVQSGCGIRLVGVSAAPEIMAWAKTSGEIDAFIYISASHNPIGHNGVKFGLNSGGVLNAAQIKPLIARFRELAIDSLALQNMIKTQNALSASRLGDIHAQSAQWKIAAVHAYGAFSARVIADTDQPQRVKDIMAGIRDGLRHHPIGIVGDLNGSARAASIDRDFLTDLGVKSRFINDVPGQIVHRIVPEGHSLDPCREELARAHAEDPHFILGYMPDNDGDRGNLVYVDHHDGQVKALEAQEVFALCCLAEMAFLVHSGQLSYGSDGRPLQKVAIAVNDPTSLRIDELAAAFGVSVFRAEVGEANVVNLASELREKGYLVRILGEGSNGGNITHPAAVRDPLNTIASILKLLTIGDHKGRPGLFSLWCQRRGLSAPSPFGLADVIATLPAWITTSAYEDRAILKIKTMDHALLKRRYETIFLADWETRRAELASRFGVTDWEELNYEGTAERSGFGPEFRSALARGGFRILFRDKAGQAKAMIWMRGSGTEPVFRVAAESQGRDPAGESWLLDWHKDMIARADAGR
jgi:phosphomannomutase